MGSTPPETALEIRGEKIKVDANITRPSPIDQASTRGDRRFMRVRLRKAAQVLSFPSSRKASSDQASITRNTEDSETR